MACSVKSCTNKLHKPCSVGGSSLEMTALISGPKMLPIEPTTGTVREWYCKGDEMVLMRLTVGTVRDQHSRNCKQSLLRGLVV